MTPTLTPTLILNALSAAGVPDGSEFAGPIVRTQPGGWTTYLLLPTGAAHPDPTRLAAALQRPAGSVEIEPKPGGFWLTVLAQAPAPAQAVAPVGTTRTILNPTIDQLSALVVKMHARYETMREERIPKVTAELAADPTRDFGLTVVLVTDDVLMSDTAYRDGMVKLARMGRATGMFLLRWDIDAVAAEVLASGMATTRPEVPYR